MAPETPAQDGSFAALLAQNIKTMNRLEKGQTIETTVVSIAGDTIFLDLSGKSEGVVDRADFTDADGKCTVKAGDTVKVYFIESRNGEMRFAARISGQKADNSLLENAYKSKIPVEGVVEKEIKGGYEVKIGETRAFCPFSQMGFRNREESSACIGKHLVFKITEFKDGGRSMIVSNRAVLEEQHQDQMAKLAEKLTEGATVQGTIISVQDFGAFVDVEGFQALLPISEISRTRVADINEVLKAGQTVTAKIIGTDWKKERVTLSTKSFTADPWDSAAAKYAVDSKHTGTVSRIANFGAFVTLENGIDGLIHISDLPGADRKSDVKPLKTGDSLTVIVQSIDTAARRISLKPTSSVEEDKAVGQYMKNASDDSETYNPFAALLKKK